MEGKQRLGFGYLRVKEVLTALTRKKYTVDAMKLLITGK